MRQWWGLVLSSGWLIRSLLWNILRQGRHVHTGSTRLRDRRVQDLVQFLWVDAGRRRPAVLIRDHVAVLGWLGHRSLGKLQERQFMVSNCLLWCSGRVCHPASLLDGKDLRNQEIDAD